MIFSTSSFSPLKPEEREDQSFSASGTVLRPPERQAATMQPWYPFTRTSQPSFDERLASRTRVTNSILYENSLRFSVGSTRRRVSLL